MGKRKAVQGGSRRCRLEIISGASDGAAEEADPIADAIKAKQERREAELRAAAKAAASAAAASIVTWFDDMDTDKAAGDEGDAAEHGSKSPGTPPNPLASLIGYSGHDSDEEGPSPSDTPEAQRSEDTSKTEAADPENDKVADFLEELESNGLLKDDEGEDGGNEQTAAEMDTAADAGTERDAGGGDEDAEQKVLEAMIEDPAWQKVLDTDSGKVYYWNQETNEVAWEPPPLRLAVTADASLAESSEAEENDAAGKKPCDDAEEEQDTAAPDAKMPDVSVAEEGRGDWEVQAQLDSAENSVSRLEEAMAAWLAAVPMPVKTAIVARARLDDAKKILAADGSSSGVAYLLSKLDAAALSAEMEEPVSVSATKPPPASEVEAPAVPSAGESEGREEGEILTDDSPQKQEMEVDMDCETSLPPSDAKEENRGAKDSTPAVPTPTAASTAASATTSYGACSYDAAALAAAAAAGYQYPSLAASGAEAPAYHYSYPYAYTAAAYAAAYAASLPAGSYPHPHPPPLPEEPPPKLPGEESPPLPPAEDGKKSAPEPDTQQPPEPSPAAVDDMTDNGAGEPDSWPAESPVQESSGSGGGVSESGSTKSKKDGLSNGSKKKGTRKLPKGASSLLNKWEAVRNAEREAEETAARAEEEKFDVVAQKKKREREIEEWRFQQLATGEADGNANFQPLNGDWREKVKRAKQSGNASKAKATEGAQPIPAPPVSGKPDLVAAAQGLPVGWQPMWDKTSGEIYYGNLSTGVSHAPRPLSSMC